MYLSVFECVGRQTKLGTRSCLMEMPEIFTSFFPVEAVKVVEDVIILVLIITEKL